MCDKKIQGSTLGARGFPRAPGSWRETHSPHFRHVPGAIHSCYYFLLLLPGTKMGGDLSPGVARPLNTGRGVKAAAKPNFSRGFANPIAALAYLFGVGPQKRAAVPKQARRLVRL